MTPTRPELPVGTWIRLYTNSHQLRFAHSVGQSSTLFARTAIAPTYGHYLQYGETGWPGKSICMATFFVDENVNGLIWLDCTDCLAVNHVSKRKVYVVQRVVRQRCWWHKKVGSMRTLKMPLHKRCVSDVWLHVNHIVRQVVVLLFLVNILDDMILGDINTSLVFTLVSNQHV